MLRAVEFCWFRIAQSRCSVPAFVSEMSPAVRFANLMQRFAAGVSIEPVTAVGSPVPISSHILSSTAL